MTFLLIRSVVKFSQNLNSSVISIINFSGILTTYITLSLTKANIKNFRLSFFIIFRATRLLPQLMILILLTFLLPLMGSGPVWKEVVGRNVKYCQDNWWLNLFLIQNLYKSDQMVRDSPLMTSNTLYSPLISVHFIPGLLHWTISST